MCGESRRGKQRCSILLNEEIASGVYKMIFKSEAIVEIMKPGQFVNLYTESEALLLPRPISICEVDKEKGLVTVVYAVVGKGTELFGKLSKGDTIDILGPVGRGFPEKDCQKSILVGGGVGTPPLLELAKQLKGKIDIYLGYRTEPYLVKDFEKYGQVYVATDDGSVGHKGNVIELMNANGAFGDVIYACGPTPMLKGVKTWANEKNIPAWLSLEERMGCGFGACVGCVCKVVADNEEGYTYKKVCKDGPVFDAKEVLFT